MIEHLVTPSERIIIELNRHEIEFIAACAHLYFHENPEDHTSRGLIQSLVEQTNFVSSNPRLHGVDVGKFAQPLTTQQQWGHAIMNLDMTPVNHVILDLD